MKQFQTEFKMFLFKMNIRKYILQITFNNRIKNLRRSKEKFRK